MAMGRRHKFSISELKIEAAQVKRHILNEIRRGRMTTAPNITVCIALLGARSLIKGAESTLWKGERKSYIDGWHSKLTLDANKLLDSVKTNGNTKETTPETLIDSDKDQSIPDMEQENVRLRAENGILRRQVLILQRELQSERIRHIPKYEPIDKGFVKKVVTSKKKCEFCRRRFTPIKNASIAAANSSRTLCPRCQVLDSELPF